MANKLLMIHISMILVISLIAARGPAFVGAQLPTQPNQVQPNQVQTPVQSPAQVQLPAQAQQPLQVVLAQPQSQFTTRAPVTTTKPVVKLEVAKMEVKPVIKILAPLKSSIVNATAKTPKPKNRMQIMKSADFKSDDSSSKGFFSSLVNVDRAENKSKVDVHIPLIFDMTNDKDVSSGKSKLDLTVLSGLVTVNRDREKGKGPLTVTVFGIPVYTGTGNSGLRALTDRIEATLGAQRKKFSDTFDQVTGSRQLPDATMELYSNVKRTGEKGLTTITDSLDRVSSFLKEQAAPISNRNGRPASKGDIFVTKPAQFKPEDLKPRMSESAFKKFAATTNATSHDLHLQQLL